MSRPSQLAKIRKPSVRAAYPRPRLFRLLDRARRRPVLWVTGPAGSGKTTLVSTYLAARRLPSLWYQVDPGDADVANLFYYLALAARSHRRRPLPLPGPELALGLAAFSRRYFEALFARLPTPSALVFDNHQDAPPDSPWHEAIREGLEVLPPGIHVIFVSRDLPPPSLARMRASTLLSEVGGDLLPLTEREAQGLARLRRGRGSLSRFAIRRLHEITRGWAAGLVLLLEREQDAELSRPAGDGPSDVQGIFDYLATEVFAALDRRTRQFLLETALLPTFTAMMAETLTAMPAARLILTRLYRQNLFTERRGGGEGPYQYHPLFREFLVARGESELGAPRLAALRRRAADVLAENGRTEDAIDLLLHVGDRQAIPRLIAREAPSLMAQGRMHTIAGWIAALPPRQVESDVWLLYWRAASGVGTNPGGSRLDFEAAFEGFRVQGDAAGIYLAWAGIVQAIVYEGMDFRSLDRWADALEAIGHEHPKIPSPAIEAAVCTSMVLAAIFRGRSRGSGAPWVERTLALSKEVGDLNQRMMMQGLLALYHTVEGDLASASVILELLERARSREGTESLVQITAAMAEALCAHLAAEHEVCMAAASRAVATAEASGIHVWTGTICAFGAFSALAIHDAAAVRSFLEPLARAAETGRRFDEMHYHYLASWEALLRGDTARALRGAELAVERTCGNAFADTFMRLHLALILFDAGRSAEALEHLGEARRLAEEKGSATLAYSSLLVAADLALRLGDRRNGEELLRRGLVIGRAHGIVSNIIPREDSLTRLSARALEAGIEAEYVRDLIRKRRLLPTGEAAYLQAWPRDLRIFALGRFEVLRGDTRLPVPGHARLPIRLLQAIVALGGREVPASGLAEVLWPDSDGDAARRALDTTLHRLRRWLGNAEMVHLRDGKITIDSEFAWIDLWALEHLLARSEDALRTENPETLSALGDQVLALYRGPLLAGEVEAAWVTLSRQRMHRRVLRYLGLLGHHLEQRAHWERAAATYERAIEVDDLSEPLYRSLMACLLQLGRRAEALQAFARCRAALGEKLGVVPSEETHALREAALR